MLGKLFGKAGASSIRAGYTLGYSSLEGATDFNEIGDAPFGNYTGQNEPTFAAPFTIPWLSSSPPSGPLAVPPHSITRTGSPTRRTTSSRCSARLPGATW
jgi:hypothetical protein